MLFIMKTRLFKYIENFTTKKKKKKKKKKKENFQINNFDSFHIFSPNMDCGYSFQRLPVLHYGVVYSFGPFVISEH